MLIAHRGDKIRQPENTIAAFEAAHGLGACAIATDIQFSAEGTPWCFHDGQMTQADGGKRRPFLEFTDSELRQLPLTAFSQLVDWALRHPHLDWFVQLKPETLEKFGVERAVQTIVDLLPPDYESFALLTSDCRSLRLARSLGCHRVALIVRSVAQSLSAEVVTLAPDYLLIHDSQVDCQELPPGPWQWVVFEVNSAEAAIQWRNRGAHHLLTGNLPLLMRSREASDVYGF
jgi:glycerophosphoryl diester phosphodiesterase